VDAIVAIANPATGTPDIAFDIATKAIRDATRLGTVLHRHFHACEDTTIGSFLAIHDVIDADFLGAIRVGNVELFIVRREAEAVWLGDVIKHLLDFASLAINAVDGFLQLMRSLLAFVVALRAVAWIGKPDTAIRVHDHIVWSVELLAVELVSKNSDGAIVFIARHTPRQVLAADLAALIIEGVAIGIVARVVDGADVVVLIKHPEMDIVRDVRPHHVLANAIPGDTFGPKHPGMQTLHRNIPYFDFGKRRV